MDVALVFLPLAGAIIAGLFGRMIGDRGAQWVTCSFMLLSALLAVIAFVDVIYNGNPRTTELFTWFDSGAFEASWAIRVDQSYGRDAVVVSVRVVDGACLFRRLHVPRSFDTAGSCPISACSPSAC